ncbi:hypothetical protein GCM10009661_26830 [Catellatospora chokoriensis]|uniref:Uncharacterized protein n=1 Tax=Catellatospora chokoriensis TaxID=310353 RepID=A0A8J3NP53_9ACTN|nr:hypothetical protein Cch02nite_11140 [Catellatospora chokoriensis]
MPRAPSLVLRTAPTPPGAAEADFRHQPPRRHDAGSGDSTEGGNEAILRTTYRVLVGRVPKASQPFRNGCPT